LQQFKFIDDFTSNIYLRLAEPSLGQEVAKIDLFPKEESKFAKFVY
jgi:hypothetical protein